MGCAGFLGPQKLKMQVYASLITKMHAQAPQLAQTSKEDIIQAIEEKLAKKGYLRKLNDHLVSHHDKIHETLILNFKETEKYQQLPNRIISIAIVDSVIETVYQRLGRNNEPSTVHTNIQQSFEMTKGDQDTLNPKKGMLRARKMSINLHKTVQYIYDSRIDDQYFRTINYLLQNEHRMYSRILSSLQSFCHCNPHKIMNVQLVWKSIRKIVEQLEQGSEVARSCNVFYLLLSNCNQHATQQMRNYHYLCDIINIWLQSQTKTENNDMLFSSCLGILTIYINRCMGSWSFVFEVILQVYEQLKFESSKTQQIEQLCEKAVQNSDLKNQFLRGLWNHLLAYLSHQHSFSMSLRSSDGHKKTQPFAVKILGFKVLNRWIAKKYIEISQVVAYSCKSLIIAYSSNIFFMQASDLNRFQGLLIDQFYTTVTRMPENSKQQFIRHIIQQFKQNNPQRLQQPVLLKLLKQILYRSRQHHTHQDISTYFIPLQPQYNSAIKFDLIQLTGFVVQNTEDKIVFDNEIGMHAICHFLCSLYTNLVSTNIDFDTQKRYQLVNSIVSFFKILVGKTDRALLISYIQYIDQHKNTNKYRIPDEIQFFINALEYQLSHIIFKGIKLPEKMYKILHPLSTNFSTNIQTHINAYMQQRQKDTFNIQQLMNSITNCNQSYYNEIKVIFRQYFPKAGREGLQGSDIQENEAARRSRISLRSSVRTDSFDVNQCDKSFREIISMIK